MSRRLELGRSVVPVLALLAVAACSNPEDTAPRLEVQPLELTYVESPGVLTHQILIRNVTGAGELRVHIGQPAMPWMTVGASPEGLVVVDQPQAIDVSVDFDGAPPVPFSTDLFVVSDHGSEAVRVELTLDPRCDRDGDGACTPTQRSNPACAVVCADAQTESLACDDDPMRGPGQEEVCNGVDDDCDGVADESFGVGGVCRAGFGPCQRVGATACDEAGEASCSVAAADQRSAEELCDGIDNDCDGDTDEITDDQRPACGVGQCATASKACGGLRGWLSCLAEDYPAEAAYEGDERACDGLDNDCDGETDEMDARLLPVCSSTGGVCGQRHRTCADGNLVDCPAEDYGPEFQATETRCDGLDNDCDGDVDEADGLDYPLCERQDGVCEIARPTCAGVRGFLPCGTVDYLEADLRFQPEETLCDRVDNDCDGVTDPGFDGAGSFCASRRDGRFEQGRCTAMGQMECDASGTTLDCVVEALEPVDEVCNWIDDDCDRRVDEGFDSIGLCADDSQACRRLGTLRCVDGDSVGCSVGVGPRELRWQAGFRLTSAVSSGDRLFAAAGSTLYIFDSGQWPPVLQGSTAVPGGIQWVIARGDDLFLGSADGVAWLDVTDPRSLCVPEILFAGQLSNSEAALAGTSLLVGDSNGTYYLDVSDPSRIGAPQRLERSGGALASDGDRLFLAQSAGLEIRDGGSAGAPIVKEVTLVTRFGPELIVDARRVAVRGNRAYVAGDVRGDSPEAVVAVVDLDTPNRDDGIIELIRLLEPGHGWLPDIAVVGSHLAVQVGRREPPAHQRLEIFSLASPDDPTPVGGVQLLHFMDGFARLYPVNDTRLLVKAQEAFRDVDVRLPDQAPLFGWPAGLNGVSPWRDGLVGGGSFAGVYALPDLDGEAAGIRPVDIAPAGPDTSVSTVHAWDGWLAVGEANSAGQGWLRVFPDDGEELGEPSTFAFHELEAGWRRPERLTSAAGRLFGVGSGYAALFDPVGGSSCFVADETHGVEGFAATAEFLAWGGYRDVRLVEVADLVACEGEVPVHSYRLDEALASPEHAQLGDSASGLLIRGDTLFAGNFGAVVAADLSGGAHALRWVDGFALPKPGNVRGLAMDGDELLVATNDFGWAVQWDGVGGRFGPSVPLPYLKSARGTLLVTEDHLVTDAGRAGQLAVLGR